MVREVTLNFMGPIRRPEGVSARTTVTVVAGATAETILEDLGYSESDRSRLKLLADGQATSLSAPLGETRELTIFLPLGGG